MGDIPPPSSSEDHLTQEPQQPVHNHSQHQQQHQHTQDQHAFSSQFNMAQPSGNGRSGAYNMTNMANALPQQPGNFRPVGYPPPIPSGQYYGGGGVTGEHRTSSQSPNGDHASGPQYVHGSKTGESGGENKAGIVRGPPRKPRQSGHAIWIGNLPPQTELMNLVHHVCKEAPGLESLFLISKSNCAFANFKDEQTCVAAQQKLHDSKFQTVRLVSRLRKNTVEGTTGLAVPTGPAASAEPPTPHTPLSETIVDGTAKATTAELDSKSPQVHDTEIMAQKDKFFILKSLTVEDLDLSVRTGIWATQSHNEDTLNNAFKAVDNVYLVFSANKSGEYFGYAKMVSPINEDPAAAIEFAPKAQSANDLDAPKAIATEATEHAPKGRIIDDSARGTIFWEAGREDGESGDEEEESDVSSGKGFDEVEASNKSWGKPFRLEWLSTTRLPFYRTRGLRNPWNSNREVKIARDGTELEPSVGRKLIGLFNRAQSPIPMADGMRPGMAMMGGFVPSMRPPHYQ
ncbi:Zinc finger CCCH domain-containing protein 45 like [Verticillium longisporum]|uniref:Zinc finger CCCH domain-containing protein 45 like n=1 Tax=Verticillium longisporum TaxID=100787 RepID=A0A8I3AUJ2_VERLO|nr:Zinc finger CCCH domain-containing protein 45 like [Verticillium longisporum]